MDTSPIKSQRLRRPKKRRHVLLIQSWWEDRVFRGVAAYAAEHNWVLDCLMRWTHALPEGPVKSDGIIAYTGIASPQPHLVDFIQATGLPVVETHLPRIPGSGAVIRNHERIGELAAEHLLALEFSHIGFVTFDGHEIEALRQAGVAQKVAASGAQFHVIKATELRRKLPGLPKPIGLIAASDINAMDIIQTCVDCGLTVPEEVAVVGVDDTDVFCDLAAIPLTSVNCNYEQLGREAAALLDRMMEGNPPPPEPLLIQPLGVTARRSTDTIALPDPASAKFLRYLRDHFREPLSLEQIARELGVSLRRVQDHFRHHVGRSAIQELTRLRVAHAKKLLHDPKLKLESVAQESGFTSRFHFIRAFVRVTGQTPKMFRTSAHLERKRN